MKIAQPTQQQTAEPTVTIKWYQDPRFWLFMFGLLTWILSGYLHTEKDNIYLIP